MKQQAYQLLADIFDYPNPAMPPFGTRLVFLLQEEEPRAAAALAEFQSVLETAGIARFRSYISRHSISAPTARFMSVITFLVKADGAVPSLLN